MKKVTLFLVPIVMLSLAGCGKAPASPALDPYEQDIQDVIDFANKFGEDGGNLDSVSAVTQMASAISQ